MDGSVRNTKETQIQNKKDFLPVYLWWLVYKLSIHPSPAGYQQQIGVYSDLHRMRSLKKSKSIEIDTGFNFFNLYNVDKKKIITAKRQNQ